MPNFAEDVYSRCNDSEIILPEFALALCAGLHVRLGAESPLRMLPAEIIKKILTETMKYEFQIMSFCSEMPFIKNQLYGNVRMKTMGELWPSWTFIRQICRENCRKQPTYIGGAGEIYHTLKKMRFLWTRSCAFHVKKHKGKRNYTVLMYEPSINHVKARFDGTEDAVSFVRGMLHIAFYPIASAMSHVRLDKTKKHLQIFLHGCEVPMQAVLQSQVFVGGMVQTTKKRSELCDKITTLAGAKYELEDFIL